MDFSDAIAATCPPIYSPDGRLMASAEGYRVVVRECESLAVAALFSCLDRVEHLAWSPDGDRLLCGLFKRATVQVFCMSDPEWSCTIAEGPAGVVAAAWAPDSQHILLTADFSVKLSVWSLVTQEPVHLRGPKAPGLICFHPEGGLLAVAHRIDCKDFIGVYDTSSWAPVAQFACATADLAGLDWSPDGACLAAWDSPLYGHQVAVYTPEGECLTAFSAYMGQLGLKCAAWSPSGQLLALGSYDHEARVLNHVTWSPLASFTHPPLVKGPPGLVAYIEELEDEMGRRVLAENTGGRPGSRASGRLGGRPGSPTKSVMSGAGVRGQPSPTKHLRPDGTLKDLDDDGEAVEFRSRYAVAELPLRVPVARPAADKGGARSGVGAAAWSHDGSFLLTRCEDMPTSLWIWETSRLELASVIVQARPIRAAEWDPTSNRLVVATGCGKLYLWTPDGASCVHIPLPGFRAGGLRWHPDGKSLLLSNKSSFACAWL